MEAKRGEEEMGRGGTKCHRQVITVFSRLANHSPFPGLHMTVCTLAG